MARHATLRSPGAAALALALVVALAGGACGGGTDESSDDTTTTSSGGGGSRGGRDEFTWNLPVSDLRPDDESTARGARAVAIYGAFQDGCDEGAREIDRQASSMSDSELNSYRAAELACRGDIDGARAAVNAGTAEPIDGAECLMREATLSLVDERPQDTALCGYPSTSTTDETTTTTDDETTSTTEDETTTTAGGPSTSEGPTTSPPQTTPPTSAGGDQS